MPSVTARVCGVCPSAHHLAAVHALENGLGVEPPPAAKLMRELLYMGHFIHSHTLHIFVLAGPDLVFGLDGDPAKRNIVGLVEAVPDVATKALRLRTLGQRINEAVGGRGVHPVTAVIGGMSFQMDEPKRAAIEKMVDESLGLTRELVLVAKELIDKQIQENPTLLSHITEPTWYMGTVKDGRVNFVDGTLRIIDETGAVRAEFGSPEYRKYVVERTLDHSYLKPVFLDIDGAEHIYRVNALARLNVADAMETAGAQAWLDSYRKVFGRPCHQTVAHNYARVIELIYACEKAKEIVSDPAILGPSRAPVQMKAGHGVGHVEAPRGTLFHEYDFDEHGIVRQANLLVATQQNYNSINTSIKQAAEVFVAGKGDDALLNAVEFAIRSYDPCLSCATHAVGRMPLQVEVRHRGETLRLARRSG